MLKPTYMKVILIHRNVFQNRPPLVSLVQTMLKFGVVPIVITAGLNNHYKSYFKANGIKYYVQPFNLSKGKFSNFRNYFHSLLWGKRINKLIMSFPKEDTLLWIEGNYTFTSLNAKLVNSYKHVLQIQEMFNDPGIRGLMNKIVIEKLSRGAEAVIVPEYNRAHICKLMLRLNKLPYVLPNKPSFVPKEKDLEKLHDKYQKYDYIFEKKVILYQGIVSSVRSNYIPLLDAIKRIDTHNEYIFLFIGPDTTRYVDSLKNKGYNVEYIPFIPAPEYLYFTSKAYIGIVNYVDDCLNNIYCAPNKIYEYAAFGVPMLANDIPGLRYTVGINKCGSLYSNENEIDGAFRYLVKNHDKMSMYAKEFSERTSYDNALETILYNLSLINKKLHNDNLASQCK